MQAGSINTVVNFDRARGRLLQRKIGMLAQQARPVQACALS